MVLLKCLLGWAEKVQHFVSSAKYMHILFRFTSTSMESRWAKVLDYELDVQVLNMQIFLYSFCF